MMRRWSEAAQRAAERRQREDAAPRLRDKIVDLESLRLEIDERSGAVGLAEMKHVRRTVVESAPALFAIPCGDQACRDGGHDLTLAILRSLRAHETEFEGEDACSGYRGTSPCPRVLHFVAHATYRS